MNGSAEGPMQVFPGSRAKVLSIAAVSLSFCFALGSKHFADVPLQRVTWFISGLGALLALILSIFALLGLPRLTLLREGFAMKSGLSSRVFPWSEYYGFSIGAHFGLGTITFLRRGYGSDNTILNLYAASTEDICKALSVWSERYGGGG
jgi:hypothetical protein